MPDRVTDDDLALALTLADLADAITIDHFGTVGLRVETKPDMTPVSEADTAVERVLRERLAQQRPADAILGSALGPWGGQPPDDPPTAPPPNGRRWIVDPIDGTMSYVRGVPVWATLIALEAHGEPVVGVASAPALGRRWWAARGEGAYARAPGDDPAQAPRRLQVSSISDLADAQFCFGGVEDWARQGRLDALLELSGRVWRTRGYGDFWQHMLVAEGAAEIACDPSVSVWDLAAPLVIVTEAGGRFTDFSDRQTHTGRSGLATNGLLHEAARTILSGGEPAA